MTSMFTIDSHPALVLFDSGASHSFMSMGFVERHNLPLMAIPYAYKIHTAGSQIFINTPHEYSKFGISHPHLPPTVHDNAGARH